MSPKKRKRGPLKLVLYVWKGEDRLSCKIGRKTIYFDAIPGARAYATKHGYNGIHLTPV